MCWLLPWGVAVQAGGGARYSGFDSVLEDTQLGGELSAESGDWACLGSEGCIGVQQVEQHKMAPTSQKAAQGTTGYPSHCCEVSRRAVSLKSGGEWQPAAGDCAVYLATKRTAFRGDLCAPFQLPLSFSATFALKG